jgi:phosphoribosylformylglycinamidine cyclo-ligase
MKEKNSLSYKDAGVDIDKGDQFVDNIKDLVKSTYGPSVKAGIGGFSALYERGDSYLVSGTDGVGTKIKLAQALKKHDTVGIDLVAMCVNDIICTGAKPMFFLDYMASSFLDVEAATDIVKGIVDGCKQSNMALIGGETAEMPGIYSDGEYDLAGFVVGDVKKVDLVDGSSLKKGDVILGIESSGFHSNGYSLVRKLVGEDETELLHKLLTPTKIYVNMISNLMDQIKIKGMANITGGGLHNIARMNKSFDYNIEYLPGPSEISEVISEVTSRSNLSKEELYKTFNMGIGFTIVVAPENVEHATGLIKKDGSKAWVLGNVGEGNGKVKF